MTNHTLLSRRLRPQDSDTWSKIADDIGSPLTNDERNDAIKAAFGLESMIFYAASVNQVDIGGAALFRDSTRLGVALLSLQLGAEYRDTTTLHLVRTCLPFFRSVSIGQIDALVNTSIPSPLPFP